MYQHRRNKIGMNGVFVWGKKLKFFVRFSQPQILSIRLVVRTRTAKECTKIQNPRAGRAELLGSLSTPVFETRTTTGREHFACQDSGISQIFILIISNGEKIVSNVNVVV